MIDIDMEFRKGILFIRLIGFLNDNNFLEVERELKEMTLNKGIKNVVLNLDNVKLCSMNAYNTIIRYHSFMSIQRGSLVFVANEMKMPEFLHITAAQNEIQAMSLIAI